MSNSGNDTSAHAPRQPPWPAPLVAPLPKGRFAKNEEWAWARIANGRPADMALYPGDEADPEDDGWLTGQPSARPDPKDASSFKSQHRLSELFLRTIKFHEPWASAPERPRVDIFSALVADAVDWSVRETKGALWFVRCRFQRDVVWRNLHVRGVLSLQSCALAGVLDADDLHVDGNLNCSEGFVAEKDIRVLGARIGGQANFADATLKGALHADGLQVDGDLFCSEGFVAERDIRLLGARIGGNAEFTGAKLNGALLADHLQVEGNLFCSEDFVAEKSIRLLSARIGGQVSFVGATLKGVLNADRLQVGGDLFCREGFVAEKDVRILGARIGGQVSFIGATLEGVLNAQSLEVNDALFLRDMKRLDQAKLMGAKIGQGLQLRKSQIEGEIDLTGATIAGELHLDGGRDEERETDTMPTWGKDAKLILRNVSAASVAGRLDAFRSTRENETPTRGDFVAMDLTGFRYQRLGGLLAEHKDTLAAAEPAHLIAWLEAGRGDGAFNPDPYRQLARALERFGDTDKARQILRAMAEHERHAATGWRRVLFTLSWLCIDYGYSNIRALGWFGALVLGFTVWGLNIEGMRGFDFSFAGFGEVFRWLGFSFANAVPLITFDKAHELFLAAQYGAPNEPASVPVHIAWVFYAEKVLGLIILTYLAAGLSGLARGNGEKD